MNTAGRRLHEMSRRDLYPATGPQQAVVDLTNRCNNNCLACWTRSPLLRDKAPSAEWLGEELDRPVVETLLADLAAMGCEIVRYSGGGEPTVHREFEAVVKTTAETGMRCNLTTNGVRLPSLSDETLAALDELTVSIWSASAGTYSRLHPNKTGRTFDRIIDSLRGIRDRRASGQEMPDLVIANVICALNHHEFADMLKFAREVGASRVYFTLVDPVPGCTDGLLLSEEVASELYDRAAPLIESACGDVVIDNAEGFLRRLKNNDPASGEYDRQAVEKVPCLVGWHFIRVLAGGDVVPCCRGVDKPMGNLLRARFAEIWHSPEYAEFRRHADEAKGGNPYFRVFECTKSCDNLMHNTEWQHVLEQEIGLE